MRLGGKTVIACFYFDFAVRKEQSLPSILGFLLKQPLCRLEKIPEEISRGFQGEENAIGGRGPRFPDIVKMLQAVVPSLSTFVCIDALGKRAAMHRVKLLDSLKKSLRIPRHTNIHCGRAHIGAEVEKRLQEE